MARFTLLSLSLLAGCSSVSLEEVDPFGGVASALWVHFDDADSHQIILSNVAGGCGRLQAAAEAEAAYWEAVESLDVGDLDDYCAELEEPFLAYADAMSKVYYPGAHILTLGVSDGGDTEPDDDTYEVGESPSLSGSMAYVEEDVYAEFIEDYDADGGFGSDCGVDLAKVNGAADYWSLVEGELEITAVNDEKSLSGKLEGELEDDDGDNAGDIRVSVSATYCEVDP
jgi:hypothetical protein